MGAAPQHTIRFPIMFDRFYGALSTALFMPPAKSYVEVGGGEIRVRMSWGFAAHFSKSTVKEVSRLARKPISRGVHGFAGRWLVNGSGNGIVIIDLDPPQRGYVMGFPVKLRQLMISVEEPEQFMAAVQSQKGEGPGTLL
jgi:hypothetical protein